MLFLLEVEVEDPLAQEPKDFLETVIAEWRYYARLQQRGKVLAGGKLAGRRGAAAIFDVESNAEMDRLVSGLPLHRHFSRIRVTPLQAPEEALADAERLRKML